MTATFTAPASCAGVIAVIVVVLTTVTFVAATPPIITFVAPLKAVPVMVMRVPPAVVPPTGLTAATFGAET